MESVKQTEVVRSWLRRDLREHTSESIDLNGLGKVELIERLLSLNPDAASIFEKFTLIWYQVELDLEQLHSLNHIWHDAGLSGKLIDVAQAIDSKKPAPEQELAKNKQKIDKIEEIADSLPEQQFEELILYKRSLREAPFVADGNHRATACTLHHYRAGNHLSVPAYLGFRTYTKRSSALGRLQAAFSQY